MAEAHALAPCVSTRKQQRGRGGLRLGWGGRGGEGKVTWLREAAGLSAVMAHACFGPTGPPPPRRGPEDYGSLRRRERVRGDVPLALLSRCHSDGNLRRHGPPGPGHGKLGRCLRALGSSWKNLLQRECDVFARRGSLYEMPWERGRGLVSRYGRRGQALPCARSAYTCGPLLHSPCPSDPCPGPPIKWQSSRSMIPSHDLTKQYSFLSFLSPYVSKISSHLTTSNATFSQNSIEFLPNLTHSILIFPLTSCLKIVRTTVAGL